MMPMAVVMVTNAEAEMDWPDMRAEDVSVGRSGAEHGHGEQ